MGSCMSPMPVAPSSTKDEDGELENNKESNNQLSSTRYLKEEIPDWFPSENAHTDVSSQFIIKEKLGDGVTGSVFSILYKKTKCIYALKRIPRDDEFSRMQFTTEARCLSTLSHPSIIKFIDMLMDNKYYYLILEKCDYDLWKLMAQKKYLSEKKTKHIIYNLLHGIAHIHDKNLVHRDLKPENIVFNKKTHMPKLIDFGDAEIAQDDKIYTEFVGTPPYMSPERLGEHNGIELKKSDIWAIGVLTYEMYSGQRCFQGDTQRKVFSKILNGDWDWKVDRMPSKQLQSFVEQCLDLDGDKRLSAEQALQHMWFKDISNKIDSEHKNSNKNNVNVLLKAVVMSDTNISGTDEDENNVKSTDDIELCEYTDMECGTTPPIDEYDIVGDDGFESISANIQSAGIILSDISGK